MIGRFGNDCSIDISEYDDNINHYIAVTNGGGGYSTSGNGTSYYRAVSSSVYFEPPRLNIKDGKLYLTVAKCHLTTDEWGAENGYAPCATSVYYFGI